MFVINNYDSRLTNNITYIETVLNDIITGSNQATSYNITVYVITLGDPSIFGQASWETQDIWINESNFSNTTPYTLNDTVVYINDIVLLHEILHILGMVGISTVGSSFMNSASDNPPYVYSGPKGVEKYKSLLVANSKSDTGIEYIPIEDDFGSGTANAHFEEGFDNDFTPEIRTIDSVIYPVLVNEIMTGFIDLHNYLTPMSLGVLEDISFTVNYDSTHVKSTGSNLWWME